MSALKFNLLRSMAVEHSPFDYVVARDVISESVLKSINEDFPDITSPGSFPLETLKYGPALAKLNEALRSDEMTQLMSHYFKVDLNDKPMVMTVRGWCRSRDGQIHCDSKEKIVTALIYLNEGWEAKGGRLRLLRSADNLEDYSVEIPPSAGTILAFRCTDHSWHGHKPFVGQRRSLQLNWVTNKRFVFRENIRHNLSAFVKRAKRVFNVS